MLGNKGCFILGDLIRREMMCEVLIFWPGVVQGETSAVHLNCPDLTLER